MSVRLLLTSLYDQLHHALYYPPMGETLKDNLRVAYDRNAAERDGYAKELWKVAERQHFLALLQAEHKQSLLELGAGPGTDSLFFQQHGLAVTATDLSPEMIKRCRAKGLTAYVLDFSDLQMPANSFDAVYALNSLLHLPKRDLPHVLQRIHTILKPRGLFYFGVYGGHDHEGPLPNDSYDPPRFFSFYTDEHLHQRVRNVFDVLSYTPITLGENNFHFQSFVLRKAGVHDSQNDVAVT
ncbi:MAG: class I SAM-dependent methyltransferase [Chloroflexota bacterium]|nr:class I SAM-dependent methyltransferase [Chloroflexota bacterium]